MKRLLGLVLFYLSWLLWGVILIVPFMLVELDRLAVLTTSLIVAAEICFALSILLLGKAFYLAIKTRLKSYWQYCRGERKSE
ncbi:MAG: transporter suffix domain-containing protein [Mariprofundus sp.]|nr:transporter suffix domain-containing protein [Mariprofundus sp.]